MSRIGQILIRENLATENSVARALGVQHFAGGRLGDPAARARVGRRRRAGPGPLHPARMRLHSVADPGERRRARHRLDPRQVRRAACGDSLSSAPRATCASPCATRPICGSSTSSSSSRDARSSPPSRRRCASIRGSRSTTENGARRGSRSSPRSSPAPASARPGPRRPSRSPLPPPSSARRPSPSVPPPPEFGTTEGGRSGPLPHEVWGNAGDEGAEPSDHPDLACSGPSGRPLRGLRGARGCSGGARRRRDDLLGGDGAQPRGADAAVDHRGRGGALRGPGRGYVREPPGDPRAAGGGQDPPASRRTRSRPSRPSRRRDRRLARTSRRPRPPIRPDGRSRRRATSRRRCALSISPKSSRRVNGTRSARRRSARWSDASGGRRSSPRSRTW